MCGWGNVFKYLFFIGKVSQIFISHRVVITLCFVKSLSSLPGKFHLHTNSAGVGIGVPLDEIKATPLLLGHFQV